MGPGGSQRCCVNHQKGPIIEESVGNKKETSRPSPRKAAALNWEDASSSMVLPRVPRQRLFGCYRYRMHILGNAPLNAAREQLYGLAQVLISTGHSDTPWLKWERRKKISFRGTDTCQCRTSRTTTMDDERRRR